MLATRNNTELYNILSSCMHGTFIGIPFIYEHDMHIFMHFPCMDNQHLGMQVQWTTKNCAGTISITEWVGSLINYTSTYNYAY